MKKTILAAVLAGLALPAAPALADRPHHDNGHYDRHDNGRHDGHYDRHDNGRHNGHYDRHDNGRHNGRYDRHVYDARGRYVYPHRITRGDYIWRGRDGRYYCRRDNGTTGLVIGAALGALAGNRISDRHDRTLGTILGAVGGGLLGREIDRGGLECR